MLNCGDVAAGTAKSELARRLNDLVGGAYFERLLTRFSVPEELFGPLSMRGMLQATLHQPVELPLVICWLLIAKKEGHVGCA
jgi:hypothetical protein